MVGWGEQQHCICRASSLPDVDFCCRMFGSGEHAVVASCHRVIVSSALWAETTNRVKSNGLLEIAKLQSPCPLMLGRVEAVNTKCVSGRRCPPLQAPNVSHVWIGGDGHQTFAARGGEQLHHLLFICLGSTSLLITAPALLLYTVFHP